MRAAGLRLTPAWGAVAKTLHWLTAALVLAMLGLGLFMTHAELEAGVKFDLYQLHKSIGFVVLALTIGRLGWRAGHPRPPWPAAMSAWERRAAGLMHGALYALLIAQPLIGWLMVSAAPLPVPTRLFDLVPVPHLFGPDPAADAWARLAHRLVAWTLAGLVVLHVAAALKHHFVDRDEVLVRMLPGR